MTWVVRALSFLPPTFSILCRSHCQSMNQWRRWHHEGPLLYYEGKDVYAYDFELHFDEGPRKRRLRNHYHQMIHRKFTTMTVLSTTMLQKISSTSERFELSRSKINGLAIHRLNHSATMSDTSQRNVFGIIIPFFAYQKYQKFASLVNCSHQLDTGPFNGTNCCSRLRTPTTLNECGE